MTTIDRWVLPDGVDELLPDTAIRVERLRRRMLDLFHNWGYDLVMPPLIEFTDSLLSGTGSDLDLLTFKVTDQVSGRMMGVRADVTPQTARMDAHSFKREGPNRLCYAESVLHTLQTNPLDNRCPIQVGVELYGVEALEADIEVISLMVESLFLAGLKEVNLDIGHVGIYRSLVETAGLANQQESELFEILQRKAVPELTRWLEANLPEKNLARWFGELVNLAGDYSVIAKARQVFAEAPQPVMDALDDLQAVMDAIKVSSPGAKLYLDLCELRGYHYHTGIVFAAFVPGLGQAIGNGGRYDHVGEAFGRARPATGFNMSLKALARFYQNGEMVPKGIFAPHSENPGFLQAIAALRAEGNRVVAGFPGQVPDFGELQCDRELLFMGGRFQVRPVE